MSLRVAVQMDPLERINISGDSTFALMLKAQERGHKLYHYLAGRPDLAGGRLYAGRARSDGPAGRRRPFPAWAISQSSTSASDVDVVLMRQDPPFDLGYITATHLLERIQGETLVVNDPAAVRNAPEKVWVLDFAQFMPPTMVTRSLGAARNFLAEHGEIVVKPLARQCRQGRCSRSAATARNLAPLMELFNATYREPHVLQTFLPEVAEGDKRIVLIDGEVAGAINRVPGEGRNPLQPRGRAAPREAAELTDTEREICAALGPGAQAARPAVRRHRRDRRQLADRDQRHLADRHRRHRQVQRHRHARPDLGRDRGTPRCTTNSLST